MVAIVMLIINTEFWDSIIKLVKCNNDKGIISQRL